MREISKEECTNWKIDDIRKLIVYPVLPLCVRHKLCGTNYPTPPHSSITYAHTYKYLYRLLLLVKFFKNRKINLTILAIWTKKSLTKAKNGRKKPE